MAEMTDERIAEIEARQKAAHRMIVCLCKPKYDRDHRDWLMSIPARPEDDPDLVFAASLRD
jgi:hypothetical protein